jgi:hypothetical protein
MHVTIEKNSIDFNNKLSSCFDLIGSELFNSDFST